MVYLMYLLCKYHRLVQCIQLQLIFQSVTLLLSHSLSRAHFHILLLVFYSISPLLSFISIFLKYLLIYSLPSFLPSFVRSFLAHYFTTFISSLGLTYSCSPLFSSILPSLSILIHSTLCPYLGSALSTYIFDLLFRLIKYM